MVWEWGWQWRMATMGKLHREAGGDSGTHELENRQRGRGGVDRSREYVDGANYALESSQALTCSKNKKNESHFLRLLDTLCPFHLQRRCQPFLFPLYSAQPAIRNEHATNRANLYELLRGLSVISNELDGLDLPITVDIMRERIDFIHSLGLTMEDINNYPLVLACSIKKNMIPILNCLEKLGVRKANIMEFLYPLVLHVSVIIDLAPIVKHLQDLDLKPGDLPRALKRDLELLGFKLEGTMSTSVAYLIGIGVARRELGGVLTRYPEILGMRVGRVIKPFIEYLESLGLPRQAVARLIEKRPHILGFGLEDQVKPNIEALLEFGVLKEALASMIA
uniref:Transcription termination factor MTERF4, chloroplastic-like n=1 Tax=Elaeis guineensis var. tenera TaxID=51953 RepID=A0A8N4ESD7_ELAGV|nr:transcription termination factor MTERF4, chloroplastic-like [Elaeis guineensis]